MHRWLETAKNCRHLITPVWVNCAIMVLFTVGGVIAMETVFVVNL